jgi:hypothetical protein
MRTVCAQEEYMKNKKLNGRATITVNLKIWEEFNRKVKETVGTSRSSVLTSLMSMFNQGGEMGPMTEIITELLGLVIIKAVKAQQAIEEKKLHAKKHSK